MAVYVTKKCGECGAIIEGRHSDAWNHITKIGVPFTKCPHCGCMNVDKHIKEYNMLNTLDYISMCKPSIYGGFGWGMILTFIYVGISQNNFSVPVAWTILILTTIIVSIIGIKRDLKEINEEIEKSKKRLEDKEYKIAIAKLIRENRKQ